MIRRYFLPVLAAAALAGCPSAPSQSVGYAGANAPSPSGALGGLIGDSASPEDAAVRDTLLKPTKVAFPTRVGMLFYGYTSALKAEDQAALLATVRSELVATGLVKTALQIPQALVGGSPNLASLRKLAARFQVDVLLLLSGQSGVQLSDAQPTSFFDSFGNKAWFEGRASVDGLAVDVSTGLFFTSFKAAGQNGPVQADRSVGFDASTYPLAKQAETAALQGAKQRLVEALTALKASEGAN
ncbi:MAG: hypothetical protein JWM80_2944 [Cyanobacteria bacterium RYN_339]|nr:hypothetical protein [Cyanobacteria bacterium RYN_339]